MKIAAIIGLLLGALAALTACGHDNVANSGHATVAPSNVPPTTTTPNLPASTTPGGTLLHYSMPLDTAKGYKGVLTISFPLPEITLGDPGYITVGALDTATATVTNGTVGNRSAYASGETFIYVAWALPPALAQSYHAPYLVERVFFTTPGLGQEVEIPGGQGLVLGDATVRGLTFSSLADVNGIPLANKYGTEGSPPAFAETDRAVLAGVLSKVPQTVFWHHGYNGEFQFGGGDDSLKTTCKTNEIIYGVINSETSVVVNWPAVKALPGQPCHAAAATAATA